MEAAAVVSVADRIYERLETMEIGETLCYHDLEQILGRKAGESRSALYAAMKRLERQRKRTLSCVPNVGYRMVAATEHEKLARIHHKKSQRQMKRAAEKLESADRTLLSATERRRIDGLEMSLKAQQEAIRHLEARQARTDSVLDSVRKRTDSVELSVAERMARMEAMIEKLAEKE